MPVAASFLPARPNARQSHDNLGGCTAAVDGGVSLTFTHDALGGEFRNSGDTIPN